MSEHLTPRPAPPEFIDRPTYHRWIETFEKPGNAEYSAIAASLLEERDPPRISVVMPVHNTPPGLLEEAIESVLAQIYPHWELCIADDASTEPQVPAILEEFQRRDGRIKCVRLAKNGHISRATNAALELATGDFVALLDHDDLLARHALLVIAHEIRRYPDASLIYTDSDNLDPNGERYNPFFKPDWNYELLLGQNYINHLTVYRRERLTRIGGCREGFEGSQDYDLLLRFCEGLDRSAIRHIPQILYHWRAVRQSFSRSQLALANQRARTAIAEHLNRIGQQANVAVAAMAKAFHRVVRPRATPTVSIIATVGSDAERARDWLTALVQGTAYPRFDVAVVESVPAGQHSIDGTANESTSRTHEYPTDDLITAETINRTVRWKRVEESAVTKSINELAEQSRSDVLVFLNDSLRPVQADWLCELVSQAIRREIGIVATKIVTGDGRTVVPGALENVATLSTSGAVSQHLGGVLQSGKGYFARCVLDHEVAIAAYEAIAIRADLFRDVRGWDPQLSAFPLRVADLCLRMGQLPLTVLWSAHATLQGAVAAYPAKSAEIGRMNAKWGTAWRTDPFGSRHLGITDAEIRLALPSESPVGCRHDRQAGRQLLQRQTA